MAVVMLEPSENQCDLSLRAHAAGRFRIAAEHMAPTRKRRHRGLRGRFRPRLTGGLVVAPRAKTPRKTSSVAGDIMAAMRRPRSARPRLLPGDFSNARSTGARGRNEKPRP